ncbi:MAG TPA: uracil-DNA glycosylase [Rhodopila sp.]|uniref:uracil-DNA glycosylase n=1 Tax=Rhodopila sp. TaxID=2480087 RepID=UPI002D14F3B1|nr:uracil-DNA glycosylase [Rhodopila sp.]HVY15525.1 uracil-DNA glycosylase [Rhodopila sp.]
MTLDTDWTALHLQLEWGADEALVTDPVDRLLQPERVPLLPSRPAAVRVQPETPVASLSPPHAGTPGEQALAAAGAAQTLDALRAAIAAFEHCALKQTASHLVFAEGNPESAVLLIGDPPGREEDRGGHPFAGPEGQLLDQMLGSIGLRRETLMLTPLIPWRPPGGRPANPAELALLLPFLHRLIALLGPAHVLILGNVAAKALLGQPPRRQAPVDWVDLRTPGLTSPVPALVLPSPGELLKKPPLRRDAWRALRKLHRALDAKPTNI